jgi:hypothetical protein
MTTLTAVLLACRTILAVPPELRAQKPSEIVTVLSVNIGEARGDATETGLNHPAA